MPEAIAAGLGWWVAIAALLLAALALVMSAMLERSGPIRLRHWAEEAGGRLHRLYEEPARFEIFRYLLNLAARMAPAALLIVLALAFPSGEGAMGVVGPFLGVTALVVAVELLNRTLVIRRADVVLRRLTILYRMSAALLTPLIAALAVVLPRGIVERPDGEVDEEASERVIEAFLDVGTSEGFLDAGEEDMILRVIDFGDERVKSVMTPRIDMVCAPLTSDLEEVARFFLESGHSRIPLFRGSVDEVAGVLHIRDLFSALRGEEKDDLEALVMRPYFVPETKRLDLLLKELQAGRQQMAVVVDEYGGTAGLVTIEDLLEEIVGEIADEHEEEPPKNEKLPDGSWRLDGMSDLDTLHDLFGVEIEREPYETVGGLVLGLLGEVPVAASRVEAHGLSFEVERIEGRRIQSVVVRRRQPADNPKP